VVHCVIFLGSKLSSAQEGFCNLRKPLKWTSPWSVPWLLN